MIYKQFSFEMHMLEAECSSVNIESVVSIEKIWLMKDETFLFDKFVFGSNTKKGLNKTRKRRQTSSNETLFEEE